MTREQAIKVINNCLAKYEYIKRDQVMLARLSVKPYIPGEDAIIYRVVDRRACATDFPEEEYDKAVNFFLKLCNNWCPAASDKFDKLWLDANDLRQQNMEEKEAEYLHWCEVHFDQLLEVLDTIQEINADGKRTISFCVPRCDSDNYRRFFKERHFEVQSTTKADIISGLQLHKADEETIALNLQWKGRPRREQKDQKREQKEQTEQKEVRLTQEQKSSPSTMPSATPMISPFPWV